MSFRSTVIAAVAFLCLTACSTAPRENCLERLESVPKTADGTTLLSPDDQRVFGFHTCMARQGHKPSMLWLGEQYEKGSKLVTADQEKAFEFYLQAATDDPTRTSIYVPGIEGKPGTVMSFESHGATKGLAEAKYRVGLMYAEGRGTKQSDRLARRWMKRAATQGHAGAKAWLEGKPKHSDPFTEILPGHEPTRVERSDYPTPITVEIGSESPHYDEYCNNDGTPKGAGFSCRKENE